MKKKLSLLVCLLLLAQSVTGCSESTQDTQTDTDTTAVTEAETLSPAEEALAAKNAYFEALPAISAPGTEITFIANFEDIAVEELTGDRYNDAVFNRNLDIEQRLDVKIVTDFDENHKVAQIVTNNVTSGDAAHDLVDTTTTEVAKLLLKGCLMDMDTVSNMQLDKEWWNQSANNAFTLQGFRYCVMSALNHQSDTVAHFILVNKNLCEDYGMDVPYDAVLEGTWTYDLMYEMACQLPYDSNGDGSMDQYDIAGIMGGKSFIDYAMMSGGVDYFIKDENDIPVFSLLNEQNVSYYDHLFNIFSDADHVLYYNNLVNVDSKWGWFVNKYAAGEGLFLLTGPVGLLDYVEMEDDYGILPMAKIDVNQESYRTMTSFTFTTCISIPKVYKADPADMGIVLDAMSYLSHVDVRDVYVNSYLESRWVRDEESVKMVRLALDNIYFDPSFVMYEQWGNPTDIGSAVLATGTNTLVSTVRSRENAIKAAVQKTLDQMDS
ncbi:MAG: hypothetical protein IKY52_06290 [Clostridia bacterium]|nr:hypothetical protein [Clostridia bacterium]